MEKNIDEITTPTAVGGGFRKDTLPNRDRDKREDKEGDTCYCPICKEKKSKLNKEKSCCEQSCPDCDSVMTNVGNDSNE